MLVLAIALSEMLLSEMTLFVPPPYSGGGLGGTYSVAGIEPDGKVAPPGTATITHVGGDRYRLVEQIAGQTIPAVCLRAREVLTCGWASKGQALGVAIYEPTSDGMMGTWWEDDGSGAAESGPQLARERLVGGAADLSGYFTIAKGERPDGSAYTGYATSDVLAGVHRLAFHSSGAATPTHRYGFGLREGDLLTVGFNAGATCGVVTYRILGAGAALSGRWVDPSRATGTGTETLLRI